MIKKYKYLFFMNIFISVLPYYFISILLLKYMGLSYTTIGVLSVITEICGTVFDIPMSYISQKIGYKKILIISNFLLILGLSCLMFSNIKFVILSSVFIGLAESLCSGVGNSYNYEIINDDLEYESFLKHNNGIKYLFVAFVTIISPYLLKLSYVYPLIVSIFFCLLSLVCLYKLPEVSILNSSKNMEFPSFKRNLKKLPWDLIIVGVSFSTLIMVCNSYASVLLNKSGVPLEFIGFALFLFNISMSLGSYLKINFSYTLLLPLLPLIISCLSNYYTMIILFILMRMINANYNNHFYTRFNKKIENNRAISWSIYNFLISISFIFTDLFSGIIADLFGLYIIYRIYAFITITVLMILFIVKRIVKKI